MAKLDKKKKTNQQSKTQLLAKIEDLEERVNELEYELEDCNCDGYCENCADCDTCSEKDSRIEELEGRVKELEEENVELDEQVIILRDEQKEGMKDAMDEIATIAGRFDV